MAPTVPTQHTPATVADQDPLGPFERVPPHDADAEAAVLGGMMASADAIGEVVAILKAGDFYRPAHATVYTVIVDLYARGEPANPITVSAELKTRGELDRLGGPAFVHGLFGHSGGMAEHYATIVRDQAIKRGLTECGMRITQLGYLGQGDGVELGDQAQADLMATLDQRTDDDPLPPGDTLSDTIDEIQLIQSRGSEMTGVPTGFKDLDKLTNGLQPGQLIVVAGRPSLGKSTLALDMARACAVEGGQPTLFFSLEMGRSEVNMRLLSAEARVSLHHMRSGTMTDDDWTRIARRAPEVSAAPLFVDDSPLLNLLGIRAKCRRIKQKHGLKLVVVDYLQLLEYGGGRTESRQVEVSQISRSLKLLAKELQVPVVALSQLNRGPEQRTDKKPMLSDLRESGAVEQDADVVILLHREDAYEKDSPRAGEADLIVAKHRNGPTAVVTTAFQGHYSRFVDMAGV